MTVSRYDKSARSHIPPRILPQQLGGGGGGLFSIFHTSA